MNTSPSFSQLMNNIVPTDDNVCAAMITDNWMQGRTTYGGLSAAMCLKAIEQNYPDLPPLRSAQVNFIGPVGGDVIIKTAIMRKGKSVAYISAEISNEAGLSTHAVFCFGEKRASRLDHYFTKTPNVPPVEKSVNFFEQGPGPIFTNNFDCLLAKGALPISGSDQFEHFIWARHKDRQANDLASLIGVGDMPPPAVLPMFKEFAPISSMTWMMNFLSEDISTEDGWWLLRSAGEHAKDGYSSQDMQIWNTSGKLIVTGRQNVAIFY